MYLATEPSNFGLIEQTLPGVIAGVGVALVIEFVIRPIIAFCKFKRRKKVILIAIYQDTVHNLIQARNLHDAAKKYRSDPKAQHVVHTHSGFSLSKDLYVLVIRDPELVKSIGMDLFEKILAIRATIDAAMERYPDFVKHTQNHRGAPTLGVFDAFARSLEKVVQHSEMVLDAILKEDPTAKV